MKKLTCILTILTCVFSFNSCGSNNSNSGSSTETTTINEPTEIETTTESSTDITETVIETITTAESPDTTEKTITTTVPVTETSEKVDFEISTSATMADMDNILISIAESKGLIVAYDDVNISFSAEQSVMDEIALEFCNEINSNAASADTSNSTLKGLLINDTYDTIEFYVTEEFMSSMDSLAVILYTQPMTELQILTGKNIDDVCYTQKIINVDTGEIIDEYIMPDALSQ